MVYSTGNDVSKPPVTESKGLRFLCIGLSALFLASFLLLPIFFILTKAFQDGFFVFLASFTDPDALSAIKLSCFAIMVSVILNTLFGLAAGWALGKFNFRGKSFLMSLIDLPFTISPVISGLIIVLLLGSNTILGSWLEILGIKILFSPIGIIMVTTFVTFPFVAREVIPLMQSQGQEEEEASLTLGAGAWQTFFKITLPNIKWGLFYGVLLCAARAAGEFGAVSVVSGHIRGLTNTLPLHIEISYNEYHFTTAFALASSMIFFCIITILLKHYFSYRSRKSKS